MSNSSSYMKLSFAIPHQHVGAALALLADWGATGLEFHNVEIRDGRARARAKRPRGSKNEPAAAALILAQLAKAPALRVELLSQVKAAGLKPYHLNAGLKSLLRSRQIKKYGKKYALISGS